jgi:hypothetical protein
MGLKANISCGGVSPIIELSEIGSSLHEKTFQVLGLIGFISI